MGKKIKRFTMSIAVMTSAVPATAPIVSSLSSCSKKTYKIPSYDKEYGISRKTYKKMKANFANQYKLKLKNEGYHGEILKEKMNEFCNTITTFDKTIIAQTKENRYTVATHALTHFAKSQYDIDLKRDQFLTKKITWSSVDQMFQGIKNSCDIYLKNNHIPDQEREVILQNASNEYNRMKSDLTKAYPHDALSAIMKAQIDLTKCFEDVNEQIALVAAQCRLKDFMTTYNITYKDNPEENGIGVAEIDAELNNSIGKTLNDNLINKIFEFTNVTDGKTITFQKDIIPDHIINPVLLKINNDKYSNKHSLDIDWQIHKVSGDAEKEKRTTAHLYLRPNKNKFNEEGILISDNINDLMADAPIVPTGYGIRTTAKYAKASVIDTYFNPHSEDGYISGIHWSQDTSKPNPWETLFVVGQNSSAPTQHLSIEDLAKSGLELDLVKPDGGGTITHSLQELLLYKQDSETTDEDLDLAQKFVKYCNLCGDITIVADESKNHTASAKFFVAYQGEKLEELPGYDIDNETNFAISEKLYAEVNMDFNKAYKAFDTYKNEGIVELKAAAIASIVGLTVSLAAQTAATATIICNTYKCVKSSVIPKKISIACAISIMSIVQLIVAAGTATATGIFTQPIFDFSDRMDDMKNKLKSEWSKEGTTFNKIVEKFDNDHKNYFVLWEEDKNPDNDFAIKKKHFTEELPWLSPDKKTISAKGLKEYYRDFLNSNEWNAIQTEAENFHVAPKDFKNTSDKYTNRLIATDIASQVGSWVITNATDAIMSYLAKKNIGIDDLLTQKIIGENVDAHKYGQELQMNKTGHALSAAVWKKMQLTQEHESLENAFNLTIDPISKAEYKKLLDINTKNTVWLTELIETLDERVFPWNYPWLHS